MRRLQSFLLISAALVASATLPVVAQQPTPGAKPAAKPAANAPANTSGDFFIHQVHASQLSLDCNSCHVPDKAGSVVLKRPGHDQCMVCHADAFGADLNQKICAQCHSAFPPSGSEDLLPFPRYKRTRTILFEFSHAKHVDPLGRVDPKTGFRADCTFCHKFENSGQFATFPAHPQCASCHSKAGMKPMMSGAMTTADCRGCHSPEEIENPGFTKERRMISDRVVSGKHVNLKFSHIAHFKEREQYKLNCTTCHYAVPASTSLTNLTLPRMIDCVDCHDTNKNIPAEFRMTNCQTCHIDKEEGGAPASHTRYVKPDFHTESFRSHHEAESSAPGAKCFVCHQNVQTANTRQVAYNQCIGCHLVMRPASHTARWRDDLHGKYAAFDREQCSLCHQTDYCVRCHNELPNSHVPLALWKAGSHATLAMLNERACLTCHTFANTCSECHARTIQK
jgi:hypothetical protein